MATYEITPDGSEDRCFRTEAPIELTGGEVDAVAGGKISALGTVHNVMKGAFAGLAIGSAFGGIGAPVGAVIGGAAALGMTEGYNKSH